MIKRHPVAAFYILAFLFSWLGWIPQLLHARGLFPFDSPLFTLLGGVGPTLAALVVTLLRRESGGVRNLFRPLLWLKASPGAWIVAFAFWWALAALALGLMAAWGHSLPALARLRWTGLPPLFIAMLLSNVWEEIGWRGFALPRLRETHTDSSAALIMGLLWSLWHLPLLLNPASPMSALPGHGEVLFSLALTVLYTWLYAYTGRSLFFVTVFHAMSNTVAGALSELGLFVPSYPFVVGLTALAALAVLLRYGPRRFGRAAAG